MTAHAGRGVFATRRLAPQTLVHVAHCIRLSGDEYRAHLSRTVLEDYLFKARGSYLLALGYGSLFNHSRRPNLDYKVSEAEAVVRFYAAACVEPGDELCIYYGPRLPFEPPDDSDDDGDWLGRLVGPTEPP